MKQKIDSFRKIYKIDKPFAKLTKKWKGGIKINKSKDEKKTQRHTVRKYKKNIRTNLKKKSVLYQIEKIKIK